MLDYLLLCIVTNSVKYHIRCAGFPIKPNLTNKSLSLSMPGLLVVNNLSPLKIEFAPALNIIYCSASVKDSLPAESLTIVFGITILAVAIIRAISKASTFASDLSSPDVVPETATSAFIGTDSGCLGKVARTCNNDILFL